MKQLVCIFFLSIHFSHGFCQIDTVKSQYEHLDTVKAFNWGASSCAGCGQPNAKYRIENKLVSKATYDSCQADLQKMITCTPCYLKVYNKKSGQLVSESAQYTDCNVGVWIEYYPSGKISRIMHFKENKTNNWKKFPCSVLDGVWKEYKKDGSIVKEEIWKDGKLIFPTAK